MPNHAAPRPVSSGISFRKLPTVSCDAIESLCRKYRSQVPPPEVHTRCSRLLEDCCKDVTALAKQLQHQIQIETCELRTSVRNAGTIVREWSSVFAHQGVGPRDVMERLVGLEAEVATLRAELQRCECRAVRAEGRYQAQVDATLAESRKK